MADCGPRLDGGHDSEKATEPGYSRGRHDNPTTSGRWRLRVSMEGRQATYGTYLDRRSSSRCTGSLAPDPPLAGRRPRTGRRTAGQCGGGRPSLQRMVCSLAESIRSKCSVIRSSDRNATCNQESTLSVRVWLGRTVASHHRHSKKHLNCFSDGVGCAPWLPSPDEYESPRAT